MVTSVGPSSTVRTPIATQSWVAVQASPPNVLGGVNCSRPTTRTTECWGSTRGLIGPSSTVARSPPSAGGGGWSARLEHAAASAGDRSGVVVLLVAPRAAQEGAGALPVGGRGVRDLEPLVAGQL